MTTNKRYKVWAKNITYFVAYIEAKDDDDAMQIAEGMDGSQFTNSEHGDWEIYSTEEIDE